VELPREEPLVVRLGKGGSVSGTVRASTGEPIAGATVIAKDDLTFPDVECETDESGRFELRGIREGLDEVDATAEGFHRTTRSIEEAEGMEIWLVREANVEGNVVDEDDGRPIAGVSVFVDPVESGAWIDATTDARGEFLVRKVPPGMYNVSFHHDEYLSVHTGPWDLKPGEIGIDISLRRGFTARGTVRDSSTAQPVDGASVFASQEGDESDGGVTSGRTDGTGRFELRGLAPGDYTVRVEARGYLDGRASAQIVPEDADHLAFTLEKAGSISGRVLDHAGQPLAGVRVFPEAPRAAPEAAARRVLYKRFSPSDVRGRFLVDGLPPFGDYGVVAVDEELGFRWVTGIAVGPGAQAAGLDIQFPAGGAVRGRVVDQTGRGMERVTVVLVPRNREPAAPPRETLLDLQSLGPWTRSTTTTSDGTYRIESVAADLYRVRAEAPGWASREHEAVQIREGLAVEGVDFVFADGTTAAGHVVDGEGRGVGGASIEIHHGGQTAFATADGGGRFAVRGLSAGRVQVYAGKEGVGGARASTSLPSADILLRLGAAGRISGRLEAPGRSAFSRGSVTIWTPGEGRDSYETTAWTDEAGRFSASIEPGPSILIVAEIPGFGRSEVETSIEPGKRHEIVIPLRRGGTIEGVVVSTPLGEPVEEAEVRLESRVGLATLYDRSGEEGDFSLDGVPEGPVVIVARHSAHRASRQEVLVVAGETMNARIELEGGQGIHGRVKRHGRPVAGARVVVAGRGSVSDPGGLYEVLGLAPGEHEVSVEAAGPDGRALVLRRRITVEEGRLTERDLDLGAVLVNGRVLRDGAPAAEVRMAASSLGEWIENGRTTTDARGEYSLDLPGGREVDLEISADGKTLYETVLLPEGPGELRRNIDLGAPPR
jgi:protocatechuate 3,4-dioxygenase beta subunit